MSKETQDLSVSPQLKTFDDEFKTTYTNHLSRMQLNQEEYDKIKGTEWHIARNKREYKIKLDRFKIYSNYTISDQKRIISNLKSCYAVNSYQTIRALSEIHLFQIIRIFDGDIKYDEKLFFELLDFMPLTDELKKDNGLDPQGLVNFKLEAQENDTEEILPCYVLYDLLYDFLKTDPSSVYYTSLGVALYSYFVKKANNELTEGLLLYRIEEFTNALLESRQ